MPSDQKKLRQIRSHVQQGQFESAEKLCGQVLQTKPFEPEALRLQALILAKQNPQKSEINNILQAMENMPHNHGDYFNNLAGVYFQLNDLDNTEKCFKQCLKLNPKHLMGLKNTYLFYLKKNDYPRALTFAKKAISLNPKDEDLQNGIASIYYHLQQLDLAAQHYQNVIELNPKAHKAYNNYGLMLYYQGHYPQAVRQYEQALSLQPQYCEAMHNLASCYRKLNELAKAKLLLEKILSIEPNHENALISLAIITFDIGQVDEALIHIQKAVQINTNNLLSQFLLTRFYEETCYWHDREERIQQIIENNKALIKAEKKPQISAFNALSICHNVNDQLAIAQAHSSFIEKMMSPLQKQLNFQFIKHDSRPLKVGYLSCDFHDHATSHLLSRLFENHNPAIVEAHVFSYGKGRNDSYQNRIKQQCHQFHDVQADDNKTIAEKISQNKIDILIDLKGYTQNSRFEVCALKPAPIQISWLGFPGTTGAGFIDYIIGDPIETPLEDQNQFSEKIIQLPHCYQINDDQQTVSDETYSRNDFDLPDNGFVFCCFNNTYKIDPDVFRCWMNILEQVPGSVLWLLHRSELTCGHLQAQAKEHGIDPQRLIFARRLDKAKHLARHGLADLFLDTFYVNAHTTASDALWTGLPLLTLKGDTFASRVSASLLTNVDLPELICETKETYQEKAVHYASYPQTLSSLKKQLQENLKNTPLFNTKQFAHDLEQAYLKVWEEFS